MIKNNSLKVIFQTVSFWRIPSTYSLEGHDEPESRIYLSLLMLEINNSYIPREISKFLDTGFRQYDEVIDFQL